MIDDLRKKITTAVRDSGLVCDAHVLGTACKRCAVFRDITVDAVLDVVLPAIEEEKAQAAVANTNRAAVVVAPLLEEAWDNGNKIGLEGLTGPAEYGAERRAIDEREYTVACVVEDFTEQMLDN